ncbi:hypothetical protein CEE36_01990 [candidate division TA06 bacterium B3_TA06]|uniref:Secretion system C-terminal sorting domain-containing protein n=1 Tax=candidate division TA06 bacterium B3_TA06 TaxID=2012487 RepID=A0A532V9M2_UNCT6|nr:MAG: hypothetical protein CEE36_01990 [candidate division TA06 bacterium B3_TA06]
MRKLSLILVLTSVALLAAPPAGMTVPQPSSGYRLLGEITDEPAWFWLAWWTGVGNLQDFLVANTMQGGMFGRSWQDYHPYEGLPLQSPQQNGHTAEYPAGSEQYYVYAAGFWFGAIYPYVDTLTGDTTWIANVSKAAYNSDMGAMAVPEMEEANIDSVGLYFSDMRIPEGWGLEGEGNRLFARPGETPKPYQALWPFADTVLNKNRPPEDQLDPAAGDMVSHQDTYAVGGDWIPADSATMIWINRDYGPYDMWGLGIRAEQRTYSWSRGALANVIVLNYKIRNMNEHLLKAPYFSYFMDPDIGTGGEEPGDDGFWDDKIGYAGSHNVGYAYDNNGSESGWSSPPGYIGIFLIETPGDVGVTGLETWENDTTLVVDSDGTDTLKYERMISTEFNTLDDPSDVRMLLNSGPYPDMAPGDEYDFTFAVAIGATLNELLEKADSARAAFAEGFPWVGIEEQKTTSPTDPLKLNLTTANISDGLIGLRYSLPHASDINIAVFDAMGRRIETLKQGHTPAGSGEITWNASAAPAGVYFVRLSACGFSCTERVLIVR